MNHPTSDLAGYVDGTLTPADRARVAAHLEGCASCRREVDAAGAARAALRSLATVAAPADIGLPAIAEAEDAAANPNVRPLRRGAASPVWTRWLAVAGVAAAVALVAGIVLPNVGDLGGGSARNQDRSAGVEVASAPATTVEVLDDDLDVAAIQSLALSYGQGGVATDASNPEASAAAGGSTGFTTVSTKRSAAAVERAVSCLETAFGSLPAAPARLLEARYEGEPAVIGVVFTGPGADQPPDTVEIYVASRADCTVVSSTRAAL
jgi:putative zinc finger protein